MTIEISFRKMTAFVGRHKEAFVVGAIAAVLLHNQRNNLLSMETFIVNKGLSEEFCRNWK